MCSILFDSVRYLKHCGKKKIKRKIGLKEKNLGETNVTIPLKNET